MHSGTIRAENEGLGKGAKFLIQLPATAPVDRPAATISCCGNKAPSKSLGPLDFAFGMVVLLNALLRAPEGYKDGDGFHLSRRRERPNPVRDIRRSLARI
jgi:hypothetical protein